MAPSTGDTRLNGHHQDRQAASDAPTPVLAGDVFIQRLEQLRRVVAGMGFAVADAEDILQDVFVQASQAAGRFETAENAARWLIRVTVNRSILEFRRRRRFQAVVTTVKQRLVSDSQAAADPLNAAITVEEVAAVRETLNELDEGMLAPLVLRYFAGLDSTAIGEVLELSPGAIRGRLHDARLALAKRLKRRGVRP